MIHTRPVDMGVAWLALRGQYARGLRFTPELEARYMQASAPERLQHLLVSGLVAVVLCNLFLISDWYMVPDVFHLSVILRLGVLTPVVLVLVAVGFFTRRWWLANLPPWTMEFIAMAGTMLTSTCLGIVMLSTQSPHVVSYRAGLIPVLVFGNLVQRLRFRYALASSLFTMLVYACSVVSRQGQANPYKIIEGPMGLLVVVVALYTLISAFNLELDERQRFLQTERTQSLRQQQEQTNRELEDMSNVDPLTGLANRRRFDDFLDGLLRDPAFAGRGAALLLIDVDHFKAFNDRYGHPSGDQCLRHIAQSLKEALPQQDGLLSRWGGEEFAIVLPGVVPAQAMQAANAVRQAVQALAMRHEASTTSDHVTISVGVAMLGSNDHGDALKQALSQADQALYRSKQDGRNRCTLAGSSHAA